MHLRVGQRVAVVGGPALYFRTISSFDRHRITVKEDDEWFHATTQSSTVYDGWDAPRRLVDPSDPAVEQQRRRDELSRTAARLRKLLEVAVPPRPPLTPSQSQLRARRQAAADLVQVAAQLQRQVLEDLLAQTQESAAELAARQAPPAPQPSRRPRPDRPVHLLRRGMSPASQRRRPTTVVDSGQPAP